MSSRSLELERTFIVTVGRTGSSLLASIMEKAGADFGVSGSDTWDPSGGTLEHPELVPIVRHFTRMNAIGAQRPYEFYDRIRWTVDRHFGKSKLHRLLPKARYFKGELDALVHWSARLGYFPKVIVSYRAFSAVLQSIGHLHPQLPSYHAQKYTNILRNGLALAATYGGCVVDYDELQDHAETDWAFALSRAVDLDAAALIAARNELLRPSERTDNLRIEPFPECKRVYQKLREYKGVCFPPSRASKRMMD